MNKINKVIINRKIYNDYSNRLNSKSQSWWSTIYKYILVSFFVISMLVVVILLDKSIFLTSLLSQSAADKPYSDLFNFNSVISRQDNAVIMLRFSPLVFVFFYSVFKNFKSIEQQKERIATYLIFYLLYFTLSLISLFSLFFALTKDTTTIAHDVFNLYYLLIPLFLINVAYEIYTYIYKRKSEPLLYASIWPLVIQIVSHTILLLFTLINMFLWDANAYFPEPTQENPDTIRATVPGNELIKGSEYLLFSSKNSYWAAVDALFNVKAAKNLVIIILLFILVGLSILGANIKKVLRYSENEISDNASKDKFVLYFAIIGVLLLLVIKTMTINLRNRLTLLDGGDSYNYLYILFIVIGFLITTGYFVGIEFFFRKNKNTALFTIYMSLTQGLLWMLLTVSIFVISSPSDYVYNVFAITIFSAAIYIHYIVRHKNINRLSIFAILSSLFLHSSLIFIYALNHLLVAQDNFMLISAPTPISLLKILTIINLIVVGLFFISILIYTYVWLQKINFASKNKGVITHEK
ncbi:MSC_0624 family F1-like ATPase-associated membrane protein [Mycoplasma sp. 4013]